MSYNFIRRKNRRKLKYSNDANYILHFIFVSNRSLCVTWRRRKNTLSKRSKHTTDKYSRESSHLEWELTFFASFFFFFSSTFGMAFFWNACRLDTIAMCVNVWYATINVHDLNAFLGIFSSLFFPLLIRFYHIRMVEVRSHLQWFMMHMAVSRCISATSSVQMGKKDS